VIILIVIIVLALLGFFGTRGRRAWWPGGPALAAGRPLFPVKWRWEPPIRWFREVDAGAHASPMTAAQFKRLFPSRACSGLKWRLVLAANA